MVDVADVSGVDEDRREGARSPVLEIARRRRADGTDHVGRLLLADFRSVPESHLVLERITVAVARPEMEVIPAIAGLVPPRQPRAAHRQRLATVERVVAGIVAVGAKGADRPGGEFVLRVAVDHRTHVAGGGERVDERPLHERVVAVLRHALEREGLEVVADAHMLQPGQFLPLDVVVEITGLVGQCKVDAERVFEHVETRAAGADPQPAELGAILQVPHGGAADGVLSEIDLVGLHLPGKDQRRFFRVFLFLLVIGIDQFGQSLFERR